MVIKHPQLLAEIEAFLSETDMGESYFGKKAAKNSELVARLRAGKKVWPDTETSVRSYIMTRRELARLSKRGNGTKGLQVSVAKEVQQ
jgi:hypothetical protein